MFLSKVIMLSDVTETVTSNGIDVTIVDSILEVTRTILGMFSVFPLNVFLTAGIVGIGIGVFKKLKRN